MKIAKIFSLFALVNGISGNYTGKAYKYGGVVVEYTSYGAKKVFETTETIGRCTKEFGIFVENKSQQLENIGWNMFRDDEYTDLNIEFTFNEQETDNNWVLINN